MKGPEQDPVGCVTAWLQEAGAPFSAPATGEWGLVLEDAGGAPLEVGLRLAGGLLAAQAWVAPPGAVEPQTLLHHNRLRALVRFGTSRAGEVFVHGEIPVCAVCDAELDRLLGALVEASAVVRSGMV